MAVVGWLACVAAPGAAQTPENFHTAMRIDGTALEGSDLEQWPTSPGTALLNEQPLATESTPLRWLRNERVPLPGDPPACVEFVGGDILPGEVVGLRVDEAGTSLTVTPAAETLYPGLGRRTELRIDPAEVQRVVWRRKPGSRYTPGTVFLEDGRNMEYRSIQWKPTGITLLTPEGVADFDWAMLAELHLPWASPWDAYARCLARHDPRALARLKTLETSDGLRVTVSTLWFQSPLPAEQRVNGKTVTQWYHYVHPHWSRDPLWIAEGVVARVTFFQPEEYPLSRLEPTACESPQGFGQSWTWQANRNVLGDTLHNGGRDYAWGLGTHAASRLEFAVADYAKIFRGRVGLDRLAGSGGCAQALVYVNGGAEPRYKSPLLTGSSRAYDLGRIVLTGDPPRTLSLVSAAAHRERPPGADPFEIRDHVDWLEPVVELDRKALLAAIAELPTPTDPRLIREPLQAIAPGFEMPLSTGPEEASDELLKTARFQTGVPSLLRSLVEVPPGKQMKLRLEVSASSRYAWPLVVMADGRRLWEGPVTKGKSIGGSRREIEVDLSTFDGRTVPVELYNFGTHSSSGSALWHSVQVVSE